MCVSQFFWTSIKANEGKQKQIYRFSRFILELWRCGDYTRIAM